MANATKVKVPVHYTTAFKNNYSRNERSRQIEAGHVSRLLQALLAFAFVTLICFAVIVAAIFTN